MNEQESEVADSFDEAEGPRLVEEASEALDKGDLDEARRLAARMREIRYTACFEYEALAWLQEGETERAIEVLREGVEIAPNVWLLWQLLGNSLSDVGEFDEALDCYESAALQPGADMGSLLFNRATTLSRADRDEEALQVLEEAESLAAEAEPRSLWRGRAWALRLRVLADVERCDEVLAEIDGLREWLDESDDEDASNWKASEEGLVASGVAWALSSCGYDEDAREWARRALCIDRSNTEALEVLRQTSPDPALAAQFFRVVLVGDWPDEDDSQKLGFLTFYAIVARDSDEAQSLALEMESERWDEPVDVDECQLEGECEEQQVGVFRVGAYHVFPYGADDDEEPQD